jgi:hypothetical protein
MNHETTNVNQRPESRRVLWLTGAAVVFVIATLLILSLSGRSKLATAVAQLRSQGLPTNMAELNSYYAIPSGVQDTTAEWQAAIKAADTAQKMPAIAALPLIGRGPMPVPPRGTSWPELNASRTFIDDVKDELSVIRAAADAGGMARFPVSPDPLNSLPNVRSVARLLALSAHVAAHDQNDLQVLNDIIRIDAVSDSIRRSPDVNRLFTRLAVYATGCSLAVDFFPQMNWNDADLERLQHAIIDVDFRKETEIALHGELVLTLERISELPIMPFSGLAKSDLKASSIEMNIRLTKPLSSSWSDAIRETQQLSAEFQSLPKSRLFFLTNNRVMVSQVFQHLRHAIMAGARTEAKKNCATCVLAAHRFRIRHGKLPQSLDELRAFLPGNSALSETLTNDPFDGSALRILVRDDRMIVYSIGENLQDDGGVIDETAIAPATDVGYGLK